MSKKLICFSLWGENPKYTIGALKNAELLESIYPGWIGRFYCGKSTPIETIENLKKFPNVEVVEYEDFGNWTGMFWRFYPASEADIEVMMSRDVDSRLNMREKLAVDEWLESDKSFHIMRDHPWHTALILGGMWGVKYPKLKGIKILIDNYKKGNYWQVDQEFLTDIVYPMISTDYIAHDEFFGYGPSLKFPSEREGSQFVGESFDENDIPVQEHRKALEWELKRKIVI